ncbi:peptide/nickel transport system permease protein [Antricoccus suffuscus]|uniref:Peptide/nickel transport system permease protein n=1 Tax=Antricoccus suffuscus TaxID=1629062 RepID=A0A2T0ZXC1_9ACTN|nr:ABC transporter permease [Antricoccus suffuscus]PRZ40887.1 peptide/nickel transport system permease protein [Antricoccus suffuscus]
MTDKVTNKVRTPDTTVTQTPRQRRWLRLLLADKVSLVAAVVIVLIILAAILAPLLAPYSPSDQDLNSILSGPSGAHLLGTDDLGRDLLSRLIYGARVSLEASVIAVGVGLLIGVPVGLAAGYFGRWIDAILMRIVDTLLAFPALVLAIGVGAALGRGLVQAMIAVGIVFAPILARLVRGQVLTLRKRLFIEVATTYGTSTGRMIRRHVIPNVMRPVIVQATFLLAIGLLAEASLSFLGLGVQPPTASWGTMLQSSFQFITVAPSQIFAPGIAIAITVLSFNLLGDFLNDVLDPNTPLRPRRKRRRA